MKDGYFDTLLSLAFQASKVSLRDKEQSQIIKYLE